MAKGESGVVYHLRRSFGQKTMKPEAPTVNARATTPTTATANIAHRTTIGRARAGARYVAATPAAAAASTSTAPLIAAVSLASAAQLAGAGEIDRKSVV